MIEVSSWCRINVISSGIVEVMWFWASAPEVCMTSHPDLGVEVMWLLASQWRLPSGDPTVFCRQILLQQLRRPTGVPKSLVVCDLNWTGIPFLVLPRLCAAWDCLLARSIRAVRRGMDFPFFSSSKHCLSNSAMRRELNLPPWYNQLIFYGTILLSEVKPCAANIGNLPGLGRLSAPYKANRYLSARQGCPCIDRAEHVSHTNRKMHITVSIVTSWWFC